MERPCIYHITGQEKAVFWLSHKIDSIMKKHEVIVNRCLDKEKKEKKNKILNFDILVEFFPCPLYRGKFWGK